MISLDEAFEIIDNETSALAAESILLAGLPGRILAEDVVADQDMPPFDRSQMDGFAVRARDTENAPVELRIVGESAAGRGWDGELGAGEAVRIMTGARVPAGADSIQKLELAAELPDSRVRLLEPATHGKYIVRRASEIGRGSRVLAAGELITPGRIACLAAFGCEAARVAAKPAVSILSTGSEIAAVGRKPGKDQIRNSNSPMIAALAAEFGGVPVERPVVADNAAQLADAINEAAADSDILVITGGVSVGKYDLTKDVLRSLGAVVFFERVRLKPGKPAVFARLEKTLIFGLPGNPVSAAVTFHLFVRRAIRKMQAAADCGLVAGFGVAAGRVKAAAGRDTLLPATIESDADGRSVAVPLKWLGSSDFVGFAKADALIFVAAGQTHEAGDVVRTYKL